MKRLKTVLEAMHFEGHISVRREIFREKVYLGGGDSETMIKRYGGYMIEKMEVIDNVLIIWVI